MRVTRPSLLRRRTRGDRGLTLVELLIVIAIVALVTGVTVPTFARYGFFFGNRMRNASREVFSTLRAAKIYAITKHVNTAVVYSLREDIDSLTGTTKIVIDSMAVVRQLTSKEQAVWGLPEPTNPTVPLSFVPLNGKDGQFAPFQKQTCILEDAFNILGDGAATGLVPIFVFDLFDPRLFDLNGVRLPISPQPELLPDPLLTTPAPIIPIVRPDYLNLQNAFAAHIFKPSGELDTPSGLERYKFKIGLLPSEDVSSRFVVDNPVTGSPDDQRFIEMQLYRSTGRVKINKDEGEV